MSVRNNIGDIKVNNVVDQIREKQRYAVYFKLCPLYERSRVSHQGSPVPKANKQIFPSSAPFPALPLPFPYLANKGVCRVS